VKRRRPLALILLTPLLVVMVVVIIFLTWIATRTTHRLYEDQIQFDLTGIANLTGRILSMTPDSSDSLQTLARRLATETGTRVTFIALDGEVLGDSHEESSVMENHLFRPEVAQALASGSGQIIRLSPTLKVPMIYLAQQAYAASDTATGSVPILLRIAMPVKRIDEALNRARPAFFISLTVVLLLMASIYFALTRRVLKPLKEMETTALALARGDYNQRTRPSEVAELASVSEALNRIAVESAARIEQIVSQKHQLETVLGSMVEGVIAVDADDRIISLNQSAGRLFGLSSTAAFGQNLTGLLRYPVLQQLREQVARSGITMQEEFTVEPDNRIVQVRCSPLGKAIPPGGGMLLVFDDITQIRHLETVRRDFVGNVSHELRTPLTSLKGALEALSQGDFPVSADRMKFQVMAERQVDRMNAIIEDLLTLARIEQDQASGHLRLELCRIRDVIDDAISNCLRKAEARSITLQAEGPVDLMAMANPSLLEQALVNLIDNALKHSIPTGLVRVSAARVQDGVEISVQDQGIGIEEQYLSRLFERFYRVDRDRSRKMGGTGLGLAIVKHIVQAHGGRIEVESKVGQGSVFRIRLLED